MSPTVCVCGNFVCVSAGPKILERFVHRNGIVETGWRVVGGAVERPSTRTIRVGAKGINIVSHKRLRTGEINYDVPARKCAGSVASQPIRLNAAREGNNDGMAGKRTNEIPHRSEKGEQWVCIAWEY